MFIHPSTSLQNVGIIFVRKQWFLWQQVLKTILCDTCICPLYEDNSKTLQSAHYASTSTLTQCPTGLAPNSHLRRREENYREHFEEFTSRQTTSKRRGPLFSRHIGRRAQLFSAFTPHWLERWRYWLDYTGMNAYGGQEVEVLTRLCGDGRLRNGSLGR
jgi:hypothetical protein